MAGSFSDFLELEVLDHVFGNAAYTAPATISFGLWTATLTDASTGATAGEPAGSGYDRVDMTNNSTNFPAAAPGAFAYSASSESRNWSCSRLLMLSSVRMRRDPPHAGIGS